MTETNQEVEQQIGQVCDNDVEFTLYCHDEDGNVLAEIKCQGKLLTEKE